MIITYSELCSLFDKKPTNNRGTQMKAINVWLDVERIDSRHYKITDIHPPVIKQEEEKPKRPVGRPRLSDEERAKREALKHHSPTGKPGRPPLSEEEKERRAVEKAKRNKNKRPMGRPSKNSVKTAKIRRPMGRPRKDRWDGKTYNYNIRSDAKLAIPARNILLQELIKHDGQLAGSAADYAVLLGMVPEHYYGPIVEDEIIHTDAMSSARYYTDLALNLIFTINILKGLGEHNKMFLVENVFFYSKNFYEYNNNIYHLAKPSLANKAVDILSMILEKYNVKSEAELFYLSRRNKEAKDEFSKILKDELGWYTSLRGKRLTINEDLFYDMKDEIMFIDISNDRKQLNDLCAERVKSKLYKHGQDYYGYNPNTTVAFGSEKVGSQSVYETYCSTVDLFIDKYVKL